MSRRTHTIAEREPGLVDAIGHYRVVGVAGKGSLGRLYLAKQHGIQGVSGTVALTCMRSDLVQSSDFRALFFDAASIAPRFEHPNLVAIHEMGEVEGSYFISTEYPPGESVASILARCNASAPVPLHIAVSVVKQATNAVRYLHDRRAATALPVTLAPGEIDVSNVFVTYHGAVKLLSVGLGPIHLADGHAVSGEHALDSSRHVGAVGAPERRQGSADPRSDVFDLGVVLWTCLTGRPPRQGSSEAEAATPSRRIVAPSRVRADVPEALDAIALRAMAPDPGERFQSVRALSEALDEYLLRRDTLLTPKHIRQWLEQMFGAERGSLQMQIAQGRDVETALALLGIPQAAGGTSQVGHSRASLRPRELWSTSHSLFSRLDRGAITLARSFGPGPPSHEGLPLSSAVVRRMPSVAGEPALAISALPSRAATPARPSRGWLVGTAFAICAALGAGTAVLLSSGEGLRLRDAAQSPPLALRSGGVDVRSTPEGAAVFVDGEPIGLRTPVVLKGLAGGRRLKLRVEKAGFASQEREIEIPGGVIETQAFELLASVGLVQFVGAPAQARIYVDEALLAQEGGEPVRLSVGPHAVRVEVASSLIFSATLTIVAGQQSIPVDAAAATP